MKPSEGGFQQFRDQLRMLFRYCALMRSMLRQKSLSPYYLSKGECVSLGLIQCIPKYVYNVDYSNDKSGKFHHEFSDIFSGLGKVNVTDPYKAVLYFFTLGELLCDRAYASAA